MSVGSVQAQSFSRDAGSSVLHIVQEQISIVLDEQHPWPGLAAYDEASRTFFHGRGDEAAELLRLIRLAPLTVLYGKSGLGKSSLLQAGLFPRLRAEHFLPVYLRVDFSDDADRLPLEQVARRLDEELELWKADCPRRETDEDLWQYLHRKDLEIWSRDNFLLTPVLVFDQFEELFSSAGGNRERIRSVFDDLADLIENRIPAEVAGDATGRERRSQLDLLSQRYRIVLAFREDFLPDVETWKDKVPSLLRNRLRLLPMTREHAIEATERAGAEVLDAGVAARIVDFVANRESDATMGEPAIEPVLLSLCCSQLNRRRAPDGRIDATLLATAGQDILEGFYREALVGMPERVAEFIETQLIQGDRYRGSYPRDEALQRGDLTAEQLAALTDRHRLLRINRQADTARIELIHDRLVNVVRQARDARLAREREREQERLRKEAERETQQERERRELAEHDRARMARMRNWLLGLSVILLAALAFAGWAGWNANQQTAKAEANQQRAEHSEDAARASGLRATGLRLAVEAQSMISGARVRGEERGILELIAAVRISPTAEVEANLLDALRVYKPLKKLIATGATIRAVAFSPDGRRLVSGSSDNTLRLWDANSGQQIGSPLKGHKDEVLSVAFSPDGRRLVSGSSDNNLRLWDANSGQQIGSALKGHKDQVLSVAFSPDGRLIVSGSLDRTVRLWDASSGHSIGAPLKGHKDWVLSVAFSPDGRRIVSGSSDKTLRIWDANSGAVIGAPLEGHKGEVVSVAFSPDGRRIASGSADKTLRRWDASTGQPIGAPLEGHKDQVLSIAFSPDGRAIVSGSWDRMVRLWDTSSGRPIGNPFEGHKERVLSVAFSPHGRQIVSGSADETVRLWEASGGQHEGADLKGHKDGVWTVAFSPDGREIVSGSADKTIRRWDARSGKLLGTPLQGHKDQVLSVAFSPDGRHIVSGSYDKALRLWDATTGRSIGVPLEGHKDWVLSVAFSPDGRRIVSGSMDRTLRLWDVSSGQPIGAPLEGHSDWVSSVTFSPDGRRIASASADKTLRLWDAHTGQLIGVPLAGHLDQVLTVAFSADGRRIVSGSVDKTLRLWDASSGQPIGAPLEGHKDWVLSVAFGPNGHHIVSGGADRTIRRWDTSSGQQLDGPLKGHRAGVQSVAFSSDGRRIVSGGDDRTLRLWAGPYAWPDELCTKLTRNMSRKEWRDWVSPDIDYVEQCAGLPIPPDTPESTRAASQ